MAFGSSKSSTTQVDSRQIVGPGGVLITQETGSGNLLANFRDENAVASATELASQAVVSAQDVGTLALQIARAASDQTQVLRLAVIAGMVVGVAWVLRPALARG